MVRGSTDQEDITIINMYACNSIWIYKTLYEANFDRTERRNIVMVGDFSTSLSMEVEHSDRKSIKK